MAIPSELGLLNVRMMSPVGSCVQDIDKFDEQSAKGLSLASSCGWKVILLISSNPECHEDCITDSVV